jgi:hypothetical protein
LAFIGAEFANYILTGHRLGLPVDLVWKLIFLTSSDVSLPSCSPSWSSWGQLQSMELAQSAEAVGPKSRSPPSPPPFLAHFFDLLLELVDRHLGFVLENYLLERVVDVRYAQLVGVLLGRLFELLDAVLAQLQLGQTEDQIAALSLRVVGLAQCRADLLYI